jgi:hypothetical protein
MTETGPRFIQALLPLVLYAFDFRVGLSLFDLISTVALARGEFSPAHREKTVSNGFHFAKQLPITGLKPRC